MRINHFNFSSCKCYFIYSLWCESAKDATEKFYNSLKMVILQHIKNIQQIQPKD